MVSFTDLPNELLRLILCQEQLKRWPNEGETWQTANGEKHSIRHDFHSYQLVCKAFRVNLQTLVIEPAMLESLAKHATDTVICREVSKLPHSTISTDIVEKALVQVARRGLTKALPSIYQLLPSENRILVSALEAAIVNAAATDQLQILQGLLSLRKALPDMESLGLEPSMMTDLPTGPLAFAAMHNNLSMVLSLIAADYTDYTMNLYTYTALEIAADLEFLDVARVLLKTPGVSTLGHRLYYPGLSPPGYPKKPSGGRDAVQIAILRGNVDMLRLFLDQNEQPNSDGDGTLYGCLYAAIWAGHMEVVSFLIDRGADVNLIGDGAFDDRTLLMLASEAQNVPMARFLLAQGADVNYRGNNSTVLMAAASSGIPEMVELYLEHGAEIDAVVRLHNGSALAEAVRQLRDGVDGKFDECISVLINAGADVDATLDDDAEWSARAVARRCNMQHIFDLLGIDSGNE